MSRELKCVSYVLVPGREPVRVEDLTAAEKAAWHESLRQRLSEEMSAWYANHPDEWARV